MRQGCSIIAIMHKSVIAKPVLTLVVAIRISLIT